MTTRSRIIYQSEALFTSPATTGVEDSIGNILPSNIVNLQRVTDISNNAEITRENVNVFGKLASISREIIEEPTISMDFTYYLADAFNESGIGFTTQKSGQEGINCLSGILANNLEAKRNFYVLTVNEGLDANNIDTNITNSGAGIIGIGNAFISNYTVDASVGEIPTAAVSVEGSNITFALTSPTGINGYATGSNGVIATGGFRNPSLNVLNSSPSQYNGKVFLPAATTGNLSLKVIRPGDIVIDFGPDDLDMGGAILPGMTSASSKQSAHIQSFSLDLPLSRTPQQRLGNAFAFSRELDVPIDVTLSVTANLGDIDEGSLNNLICAGSDERDISIKMYGPCGADDGNDNELNMMFTLKGATLDSQNMTSTIGDNKTVELTFTSQIGGPNDQEKGLFISGKHN